MIVNYKYQGADYFYDTKSVPKLQFPMYNEYCIKRFYTTTGKNVSIPVKFSFEAVKDKIYLRATMISPKDCDSISAKVLFPSFNEAMATCIEKDITLPHEERVNTAMKMLYNALDKSLDSSDGKLLAMKTPYEYPSFILKNDEIIGIGEKTAFHITDNGELIAALTDMQGPYLSMDLNKSMVEIIVLDEVGEYPVATFRGQLQSISGYNLTVKCEIKRAKDDNVSKCQEVFEEYKNPIDFFVN